MRFARVFLLLVPAVVLLLAACSPEDPFTPTPVPSPGDSIVDPAFLRVVHAAATAPAVGVSIDGEAFVAEDISYLRYTDNFKASYYPVDTSSKTIAFGSLASADLSLENDGFYTAFLYGNESDYQVLITRDTVADKPDASQMKYRVVHLAPSSPTIDVRLGRSDGSDEPTLLRDIAYGTTSEYTLKNAPPNTTGMQVIDSQTDELLFALHDNAIPISTNAVQTIVMTGSVDPRGEEPLLSFSIFQESFKDDATGYYGGLPFRFSFAAVRFINAAATGDTNLTVSFLDKVSDPAWSVNQFFRRNFPGQNVLIGKGPIGFDEIKPYDTAGTSFLLSKFLRNSYPFRFEISLGPEVHSEQFTPSAQTPVAPENSTEGYPFTIEDNRRYTLVAYGDLRADDVMGTVIRDNVPAPPSTGMSMIRLFHGGFGEYRALRLQARVAGTSTPLMNYGQAPTAADAVAVAAGSTEIQLVDEAGTTVHTQQLPDPLAGGANYTIFLTRGAYGDSVLMVPVSDRIRLN